MTNRWMVIAVAWLFHLFTASLHGQVTPQTLGQQTSQTKRQLAKSLQDYRQNKDLSGEALTLLQMGIADAALGNVDGARSNLIEAVKKMRAAGDPMGAWLALVSLSQLEAALGRPTDALPHLETALAVLRDAKDPNAPFTFKTLLNLNSASGFPPQMFAVFDDSNAEILKPMMLQYVFEPMTHDMYGGVLTQAGQLEKAEAELKAAAAGAVYSQGMYDFSIEAHWGDLRFRQQRYDEARAHYMKALNASSQTALIPMADQQIKAGIYERLERLETITGHPDEAKRWSEKARELGKNRTRSP